MRKILVPVSVDDDFLGDRVEKFGHVLNFSDWDAFIVILYSVSTTVLEAKEAVTLEERDGRHSLGSHASIEGFTVKNRGTPNLK